MVDIRPFRGLRPQPGQAAQIACPPYDVLGDAEARGLVRENPDSFVRVIRPEVDMAPGTDPHTEPIYAQGKANLARMMGAGRLQRDPTPSLYLYRLTHEGRQQHGLVAGVSVADYRAGRIKKHELTRPAKEKDRTRHIEVLGAQAGPVLLTYRAPEEISACLQSLCAARRADCEFTADDAVEHALWHLADAEVVNRLQSLFAGVEALYIADGHHRAAAAAAVSGSRSGPGGHQHFLAVAFADHEMQILGYHRLVKDLAGLSREAFLHQVAVNFDLTVVERPEPLSAHQFGMFLDGSWYRLSAKAGSFSGADPVGGLDAAILQQNLLAPILAIADPRTDDRIDFVGGMDTVAALERRCQQDMAVGFYLAPVSVAQLLSVADAGAVMPPKSTWFEPKLRSGLIVRLWEDET